MITISTKHIAILVLVFIVAAGVAGFLWHRADIQAAADRATLAATLKQQGAAITDLTNHQSVTAKQAEQDKAGVDKDVAAAKTLQAQAALLAKFAGMLHPPTVQTVSPPVTVQGDAGSTVPNPPLPNAPTSAVGQQLVFSQAGASELVAYGASCQKCTIDRANLTSQLADETKKNQALQTSLDAAKAAVNGGTKWQRFKRGAMQIGIGIALDEVAHAVWRK